MSETTSNTHWIPNQAPPSEGKETSVTVSREAVENGVSEYVKILANCKDVDQISFRVAAPDVAPRLLSYFRQISALERYDKQAKDFCDYVDSVVQGMPVKGPDPLVILQLFVSSKAIVPPALIQSFEPVTVATFDPSQRMMDRYTVVSNGSEVTTLEDIIKPAQLTIICQSEISLINKHTDLRGWGWDSPAGIYDSSRERDLDATTNVAVEPDNLTEKSAYSIGSSPRIPGDDGVGTNERLSNGVTIPPATMAGIYAARGRDTAAADVNAQRFNNPYSDTANEQGETFIAQNEPVTSLPRSRDVMSAALLAGGLAAYEGYEHLQKENKKKEELLQHQQSESEEAYKERHRAAAEAQRKAEESASLNKSDAPEERPTKVGPVSEQKEEPQPQATEKSASTDEMVGGLAAAASSVKGEATGSDAPEATEAVEAQRPASAPVPEALRETTTAEEAPETEASSSDDRPAAAGLSTANTMAEAASTVSPTAAETPRGPETSVATENLNPGNEAAASSTGTVPQSAPSETGRTPEPSTSPDENRSTAESAPAEQPAGRETISQAVEPTRQEAAPAREPAANERPAASPVSTAAGSERSSAQTEPAVGQSAPEAKTEAALVPETALEPATTSGESAVETDSSTERTTEAAPQRESPPSFKESSESNQSSSPSTAGYQEGSKQAEEQTEPLRTATEEKASVVEEMSEKDKADPEPVREGPTRYGELRKETPFVSETAAAAAERNEATLDKGSGAAATEPETSPRPQEHNGRTADDTVAAVKVENSSEQPSGNPNANEMRQSSDAKMETSDERGGNIQSSRDDQASLSEAASSVKQQNKTTRDDAPAPVGEGNTSDATFTDGQKTESSIDSRSQSEPNSEASDTSKGQAAPDTQRETSTLDSDEQASDNTIRDSEATSSTGNEDRPHEPRSDKRPNFKEASDQPQGQSNHETGFDKQFKQEDGPNKDGEFHAYQEPKDFEPRADRDGNASRADQQDQQMQSGDNSMSQSTAHVREEKDSTLGYVAGLFGFGPSNQPQNQTSQSHKKPQAGTLGKKPRKGNVASPQQKTQPNEKLAQAKADVKQAKPSAKSNATPQPEEPPMAPAPEAPEPS